MADEFDSTRSSVFKFGDTVRCSSTVVWGVRLGPAGWAYATGGDEGVQLRLRTGTPVLIGSKRPRDLEWAIRAGVASLPRGDGIGR